MRIGTKIPWPFICNLCGRGYGDDSKTFSMAITFPLLQSEGITTDVQEVLICIECSVLPIYKLVLYLTGKTRRNND